MSKSVKRGPVPHKRDAVILKLRELKRGTSADLSCATAYVFTLVNAGLVVAAGKAEKQGKGRKPTLWKLTPKGNGRATSLQRQAA